MHLALGVGEDQLSTHDLKKFINGKRILDPVTGRIVLIDFNDQLFTLEEDVASGSMVSLDDVIRCNEGLSG